MVKFRQLANPSVVGYNEAPLRFGNTMTGPDFTAVGASSIDLTSLKVGGTSYEKGACGDVVYVQILNYDGTTGENYTWIDLDGEFDPGWYDFNNDFAPIKAGDVTIDPGQGLWVSGDDGYSILFNGQVLTDTAVTVPLRFGNTPAANPFPVALDLTKITVGGEAYEKGACGDVVYVQILNYDGTTGDNYTWIDLDGEFDPGWYDFNNDFAPIEAGDVSLDPGQGLWVSGDDGFELQIPALVIAK